MSIITDRASATKTEGTLGAPVILGSNAGAGPGVAGENTGTGPGLLACGVTAPASRVVLETASLNAVQVVAEIVKLTTGATAAGDGVAFDLKADIADGTEQTIGRLSADLTAASGAGRVTLAVNNSGSYAFALKIDPINGVSMGAYAASYATGSAIPMSGTVTAVGRFYGETTGDLTSAVNCRALVARHLVACAADTVINHEAYGSISQVCAKNASFNQFAGGVMGTIEGNTLVHVQRGCLAAGVIGRPGAAGSIVTVESGGVLAAVAAVSNVTDLTHTGPYAAFAAKTVNGKHAFTSLIEVPSDLAASQVATGAPGANPYAIAISINGVTKYLLAADSWATV